MLRRHATVTGLAAAAALGVPAHAGAAEQFAGVLENNRIVRFQSDAPTSLSTPLSVRGLVPRERLLALGAGRGRVYGIGSSARLYRLDVARARARGVGQPFAQGLRGARFSLAVAPDGRQARLLSDVGQNLVIDLVTGATLEAPPLRRTSDGERAYPAADFLGDGRLVGFDLARSELLRETAPGTGVMSSTAVTLERGNDLIEPVSFEIADGRAWFLASFGGSRFRRQSQLRRIDLETGVTPRPEIRPHLRRVVTMAAIGPVADDTRRPRLLIRWPKRLRLRDLLAGRTPLRVAASEGGQVQVIAQPPGREIFLQFDTTDVPGPFRLRSLPVVTMEREPLRRRVGRSVALRVRVSDWAGNTTTATRRVRLTR